MTTNIRTFNLMAAIIVAVAIVVTAGCASDRMDSMDSMHSPMATPMEKKSMDSSTDAENMKPAETMQTM